MFPTLLFYATIRTNFVHGNSFNWGFRSIFIWRIIIKWLISTAFFFLAWGWVWHIMSLFCLWNLCSTDSFYICCSIRILWYWSLNDLSSSYFSCLTCSHLTFSPWSLCDFDSSDSWHLFCSCLYLSPWSFCNLSYSESCCLISDLSFFEVFVIFRLLLSQLFTSDLPFMYLHQYLLVSFTLCLPPHSKSLDNLLPKIVFGILFLNKFG